MSICLNVDADPLAISESAELLSNAEMLADAIVATMPIGTDTASKAYNGTKDTIEAAAIVVVGESDVPPKQTRSRTELVDECEVPFEVILLDE